MDELSTTLPLFPTGILFFYAPIDFARWDIRNKQQPQMRRWPKRGSYGRRGELFAGKLASTVWGETGVDPTL
ncbi:hypothetical protein R6Q59_010286 [Mikania micrantha]